MSFAPLQLANGPKCPRCGCRDSRILQPPAPGDVGDKWHWGVGLGTARCGHCQGQFSFREIPAPIAAPVVVDEAVADMEFEPADLVEHEVAKPRDTAYPVRECPECGSPSVIVKSSPRPKPGMPKIRYHECRDCEAGVKSVDDRKRKEK